MTWEGQLRLAEPLAALSLVSDLGIGYPPQSAIRAALLASLLAESMGVDDLERRSVYYAPILRYVGCISTAHESAEMLGGDDIALMRRMSLVDPARPQYGRARPAGHGRKRPGTVGPSPSRGDHARAGQGLGGDEATVLGNNHPDGDAQVIRTLQRELLEEHRWQTRARRR